MPDRPDSLSASRFNDFEKLVDAMSVLLDGSGYRDCGGSSCSVRDGGASRGAHVYCHDTCTQALGHVGDEGPQFWSYSGISRVCFGSEEMLRVIFQALDDNLDGVLDWSEFQEHSCSQLTPRIPVLGLVCRRCAMYFSSEAAACDRIGKKPRGGGGSDRTGTLVLRFQFDITKRDAPLKECLTGTSLGRQHA